VNIVKYELAILFTTDT